MPIKETNEKKQEKEIIERARNFKKKKEDIRSVLDKHKVYFRSCFPLGFNKFPRIMKDGKEANLKQLIEEEESVKSAIFSLPLCNLLGP
jgi:hypothetical protein